MCTISGKVTGYLMIITPAKVRDFVGYLVILFDQTTIRPFLGGILSI